MARPPVSLRVLFYMTGEAVREIVDRAGQPGSTTMLDEIAARNPRWDGCRKALDRTWPAYMHGTRSLDDAAADLVRAVTQPGRGPGQSIATTGHTLPGRAVRRPR